VPLPVHRFSGELRLKQNAWGLPGARLESRDGIYQVSGTVSADSEFDFVLTRGGEQSWTLTGPLDEPRVAPSDRAEGGRTEANAKTVKP